MAAAAAAEAELGASLPRCLAELRPGEEEEAEPGRRLQALIAIRCKHLREAGGAERFRRGGGLRALIRLLAAAAGGGGGGGGRGRRKELEIGLSILGNCCTEERARREVRKLEGIAPLVTILKRFSMESIQNRAARALGNLALEGENSLIIHASGVVPHLIGLLSSTEDPECLQSAVRTLRILADSPAHRRALTSQGAVAPLVGLLSREEPALLAAAARAVAELTRACGAPCAEQLSRHGGIARLSGLVNSGGRAVREGALLALGNLCSQGFVRPSVGGAGGIGQLVEALRKEPQAANAPAHLRALCLCCREAVNRARVREAGGLELLLTLLKGGAHQGSHARIIAAFLGFFYDQTAIDFLHGRGLIPVLVSKLAAVARLQRESDPRARPPPPEETEDERQAASFDFPSDGDRRPEGEQQAEGSSSFLSLRSWLVTEGYIESPVEVPPARCAPSNVGEIECPLRLAQSPGEAVRTEEVGRRAAERPGKESDGPSPRPPPGRPRLAPSLDPDEAPPSPETYGPEAPILLLLSRFSQAAEPAPSLVSEPSLRCLLDYLSLARAPSARCSRLLTRLACNPNCLEDLVRSRAVPLFRAHLIHGLGAGALLPGREDADGVQTLGPQAQTVVGTGRKNRELGEVLLRNLSVQAESPFGTGALTHLLLSGSDFEKAACAITLPLLCRNEALRRKLLVDHGGLHHLLETLLSSDDPLATFGAADAMATLAGAEEEEEESSESGPAPKRPRMTGAGAVTEENAAAGTPGCLYRQLQLQGAMDMHFVLDCGERLAARRGRVSRGSEVFAAMLEGGYLESRQSAVPLRGLAADVGRVLIHHLHGCLPTAGCQTLEEEEEEEVDRPPFEDSLLGRALSASGQFLLPALGSRLEEAACLRLPPSRLPSLYRFAERHQSSGLRRRCLLRLLEGPAGPRERAGALARLAGGAAEDRPALLAALHALLLEHV